MEVLVINKSLHVLPQYESAGAAGMDVRANILDAIKIPARGRVVIPTGLYVEIPVGYEAQIRPKSGLAAKHGITVLNSPGTIDSDFRGEIKLILLNTSDGAYYVNPGERMAQMVLTRYEQIEWKEVSGLSETLRGEGGLGSTGIN